MTSRFSQIFLIFAFAFFAASSAHAQIDASSPSGQPPSKEEMPKSIQETLYKHRVEQEKKDHEELIQRGEEALKISAELETSVAETNKITVKDREKLDRLEKLVKKIRKELGGDDDEEATVEKFDEAPAEKVSVVVAAMRKLQSTAGKLVDELKKTSRFSISAVAIQSSNSLLKIVKFVRFTK